MMHDGGDGDVTADTGRWTGKDIGLLAKGCVGFGGKGGQCGTSEGSLLLPRRFCVGLLQSGLGCPGLSVCED